MSYMIPTADQALAPGGEEDADRLRSALDPVHEAAERLGVLGELLSGVLSLGEGTVDATVVAAQQWASVEDVQRHGGSPSCSVGWTYFFDRSSVWQPEQVPRSSP